MAHKHFFGTDGVRGVVGEFPITPEFALKFGAAVGHWLRDHTTDKPSVLIGKDTRISGYVFEAALQAGLLSTGVDVKLLGPIATPAVAYLLRTFGANAGIMISASHNIFSDNGIKVFFSGGYKLDDKEELKIEKYLHKPNIEIAPSCQFGKASRITDAIGRYIEYCKSTINTRLTDLKVVLDCAHGSNYISAPKVFEELGAKVTTIGTEPNGININAICGSTHMESLQQTVVNNKADLGIAFDGDGDRVMLVDHNGNILDGDDILYVIGTRKYYRQKGIVGTIMSNQGLADALKHKKIKFIRTQVGDKYLIQAMLKHDWHLGGEPSGHIICGAQSTSGDGIIAALQVIAALYERDVCLADISKEWQRFHQHHEKMICSNFKDFSEHDFAGLKKQLGHGGRIIVRPSGTEKNVIRIMAESQDAALSKEVAVNVKEFITASI